MLNYFFVNPYQVGGGPGKYIIVLVEELYELCLLFLGHLGSDANYSIWYSGAKCHYSKITFGLDCFLELY
jgi:hypothetical protein